MKIKSRGQTDLFTLTNDQKYSFEHLSLQDGEATLYQNVFTGARHERLFQTLLSTTPWQQHKITIAGRSLAAPRLSAWYGDPGAVYHYSGTRLEPLPWTLTLKEVKTVVDAIACNQFNSVLLNLYRDGKDSVGWHSDAEPELGRNPVIASVSLGAARYFVLRHKRKPSKVELELTPGSVLIMAGTTQHHWRHQIPKTQRPAGPRINLTFRIILGTDSPAPEIRGSSKEDN